MKTLKLCLPILLSVALLGCNNEAVATTTQTISVQKVTPANVAKPKTTTLKQNDDSEVQLVESVTEPVEEVTESVTTKKSAKPVNSNSAVKDVIIDGTGSLVLSKADGTFVSFAPVQGPTGPQGPAGPSGPQGEPGKDGKDGINGVDGKDGKDGRGIDHLELDADKNLIAYYTDGTTQNVGNLTVTVPSEPVTPPVDNTPEYEKVGYKLSSNLPNVITNNSDSLDCTISNYSVTLVNIDNNNPSNKYKYYYSFDYNCKAKNPSEYDTMPFYTCLFGLDNQPDIIYYGLSSKSFPNSDISTGNGYFYSNIPYVKITEFRSYYY